MAPGFIDESYVNHRIMETLNERKRRLEMVDVEKTAIPHQDPGRTSVSYRLERQHTLQIQLDRVNREIRELEDHMRRRSMATFEIYDGARTHSVDMSMPPVVKVWIMFMFGLLITSFYLNVLKG